MKPDRTQFGVRKNTASPRRLVLRLVMLDLSQGFFRKLADSFNASASQEEGTHTTQTFDLSLTEERQDTTGGETLDTAGLRSLRSMFLLLDEWDRAMQDSPHGAQNSCEEYEITVDTGTG